MSGETPSNSASQQAPNYVLTFLNIVKHGEIMTKFQYSGARNNVNLIMFSTVEQKGITTLSK